MGFASVLVWGGTIDPKLCDIFLQLCVPRDEECAGGIDACPDKISTILGFAIYIFPFPPILFAILGYFFSKKFHFSRMMLLCIITIAAHWLITFTGMRLLHL